MMTEEEAAALEDASTNYVNAQATANAKLNDAYAAALSRWHLECRDARNKHNATLAAIAARFYPEKKS